MSMSLVEALSQVPLEVGRTYRCKIEEMEVVVDVRKFVSEEAPSIPESDIMLEAWLELPAPAGGVIVQSEWGPPDLPDIPEIPQDEEP